MQEREHACAFKQFLCMSSFIRFILFFTSRLSLYLSYYLSSSFSLSCARSVPSNDYALMLLFLFIFLYTVLSACFLNCICVLFVFVDHSLFRLMAFDVLTQHQQPNFHLHAQHSTHRFVRCSSARSALNRVIILHVNINCKYCFACLLHTFRLRCELPQGNFFMFLID